MTDPVVTRSLSDVESYIDTVVFDVDGVLVDVTHSTREAIRRTVRTLLELCDHKPPLWSPTDEDIAVLKAVPGFNDDVDASLGLFTVAAADAAPRLTHVAAAAAAAAGTGLSALTGVLEYELPLEPAIAKQVFEEHFWGSRRFAELFGEPARYVSNDRGLVERDVPFVGPEFFESLRASGVTNFAIVTGRTHDELQAAFEVLDVGTKDFVVTVTAEIARKPDPACLDRVVDACHPVGMLFVGDGPDDQRLVANYRMHRDTTMAVKFTLVARGDQPASSSDVDLVVSDVRELIDSPLLRGSP